MANELNNLGMTILNDAPIGPRSTIAATGLGRSGTTMIARTMFDLGLPMWDRLTPQSCEDKMIQGFIKSGEMDSFAALCRTRSAATPTWGFKVPALRGKLLEAQALMENPRFVITFRDVLAIALRNEISIGAELFDTLKSSAEGYVRLIAAIRRLDVPVLLISYEKALQNPEQFVRTLSGFCGISKSDSEIHAIATANVLNGDPRYRGKAS